MIVSCPCGKSRKVAVFPLRCSCGRVYSGPDEPVDREAHHAEQIARRKLALEKLAICESNICGHCVGGGEASSGCGLVKSRLGIKPCRTFNYLLSGGGCLADPPLFPPSE